MIRAVGFPPFGKRSGLNSGLVGWSVDPHNAVRYLSDSCCSGEERGTSLVRGS